MDTSTLLLDLIAIQKEEGYLPKHRLLELAKKKNIPLAKINEVATFYSFLKTKKGGKYIIRICNSPSCYLHNSLNVIATFEKLLGISLGETTKDGKFSLETTSCIGCCDRPPAAMINDTLYIDLTEEKIKEIIATCK
jgi:NADH-quinone oxidoreductase subunit E